MKLTSLATIFTLALSSFLTLVHNNSILDKKKHSFWDSKQAGNAGIYLRCDSLLYFYYYSKNDSSRLIDDRSDDIVEYYQYKIKKDTLILFYEGGSNTEPLKYLFKRNATKLTLQMVFKTKDTIKLAVPQVYLLSKDQKTIPIGSETFSIDSIERVIDEVQKIPELKCN